MPSPGRRASGWTSTRCPPGSAGAACSGGNQRFSPRPQLGSPGCGRRVAARGPRRGLLLWSQACSGREASLNTPAGGCRSGCRGKSVPSVPGTVCSPRSIGSPAAAPGWTAVSAGPGGGPEPALSRLLRRWLCRADSPAPSGGYFNWTLSLTRFFLELLKQVLFILFLF